MRKTVNIKFLRDRVNFLLANTGRPCRFKALDGLTVEQAYRLGAASALEAALHETGNYRGFGYHDVDHTVSPPAIPDETRRVYY